ncbi:Glutaredoxin [Desulfuromonas soudanensis]|uniref:Glutaredoxin n=1 Tax=Desulfuromonas soudanensis TaxID=1603606 RepID=A0A0M4CXZ2_9BACT|nr:glutaredoxin family protein [Desulfuromonas soudanensis]ALC17216.1 Glutaredoxin [Desulfuromonas soudanensis]
MDKFFRILIILLLAGGVCTPVFAGEQSSAPAGRASMQGETYPRVELFTTAWCGYCKRAKAYLRSRGVPFTEYDVEKDSAAARRFRILNPGGGVPVALIGDFQINGFNPAAYEAALGGRP